MCNICREKLVWITSNEISCILKLITVKLSLGGQNYLLVKIYIKQIEMVLLCLSSPYQAKYLFI